MTITRIISIGVATAFALAIGITTFDPVYAATPCCGLRNGVWIVLKTGKPASPAQIRTMQSAGTIKADAPMTGGTTGSSNAGGSMGHGGGK